MPLLTMFLKYRRMDLLATQQQIFHFPKMPPTSQNFALRLSMLKLRVIHHIILEFFFPRNGMADFWPRGMEGLEVG